MKGDITRGVATIFIAFISSFLAFGYYEWLAVFLSGYVASVGPWAQLICFALLFVVGFALLQTGLIAVLRDPIDLGDLAEKINPYLRPLYDALHDMMDPSRVSSLIERGTIEVAPLAFMRGRTLNDSFVVLDEAQNTTPEQMKMFLTRLGFD